MRLEERWFRGHLKELSRAECMELLATRPVGRVAYSDPEGPIVLPVNYVIDEDSVLFRTAPQSVLAQHLRLGRVAFQVDDLDEYTESGWSVLVRGRAAFVEYDAVPADVEERPNTWAGGTRSLYVRITPQSVTGRRLMPA